MNTQDELSNTREEETLFARNYLKGVIDFVKWTSTVVVASILWMGSSIFRYESNNLVPLVLGMAFLISSLIVSIFTVKRILKEWGDQWELATAEYNFFLIKRVKVLSTKISKEKENEALEKIVKIVNKKHLPEPKEYNRKVAFHVILLVAGLAFYIISLIIDKLYN